MAKFSLTLQLSENLSVNLLQNIDSLESSRDDNTVYALWPSSCLLGIFLKHQFKHLHQLNILELGAGLGLTAIFASNYCNVENYYAQEIPDDFAVFGLRSNLDLNGAKRFKVITGFWGTDDLTHKALAISHLDYVLLADCFYAKDQFPYLLRTISEVLSGFPNVKVICVHHLRNINESIIKYLDLFQISAEELEIPPSVLDELQDFVSLNRNVAFFNDFPWTALHMIEFRNKHD